MRSKTMFIVIGIVLGLLLAAAGLVVAGSLNPGSGPGDAGSQMYTLEQIYSRINNGAAATKMTAFTEPTSGPASTMVTLDALYDLAGQRSRPAKTGQTTCYNTSGAVITCTGTGQDGDQPKGVAWPTPRFTANADNNNDGDCVDVGETCNGTVTDNLTGLIWLKNANCFDVQTWVNALSAANTLSSGECGLSDGSAEGAWRLPNVREQQSLIDYGRFNPALPSGHPFTGVRSNKYWTSTTYADFPSSAWSVSLNVGNVLDGGKANSYCVWPVRGGQ